jgi:hypothetical protein
MASMRRLSSLALCLLLACFLTAWASTGAGEEAKPKSAPGKDPASKKAEVKQPVNAFTKRQERKTSISKEGGGSATEKAVTAALGWLLRHQSPDGGWRAADFVGQCKEACKNKDAERYGKGLGVASHDTGVTALAILAFTGAGYSHLDIKKKEYAECLAKATAWLKKGQATAGEEKGRYGTAGDASWIYGHAMATLAMTELLLLSGDAEGLKESVTSAVQLCLRAQNEGMGWRYSIQPKENDTSVTGWMLLALRTAKGAALDIPAGQFTRAFAGGLAWFDRATTPDGRTGYMARGDEGSRLNVEPYFWDKKELPSNTGLAILCRLLWGKDRSEAVIKDGTRFLSTHPPRWKEPAFGSDSTVGMYYWFHASHALFQVGGQDWKSWNKSLTEALLKTQRRGGCEDGSWDPIDEWGRLGGRVYSTAVSALCLEVYYRYPRVKAGAGL